MKEFHRQRIGMGIRTVKRKKEKEGHLGFGVDAKAGASVCIRQIRGRKGNYTE